ncbi:MAG TPA: HepT-like ribonuclease domain-containing protein [Actinomycetota bacterium]|nr:HepT-like ribonuclease domain-containing protein [Actinomycetota bacterium]
MEDIVRAAEVADEIVRRGQRRFESDPVAQFGAEAVVGRVGDAASKLPEEVRASMPGLPWKEIIGFRIIVDHAYHRLDYGRVWNTLCEDIPRLRAAITRYRG